MKPSGRVIIAGAAGALGAALTTYFLAAERPVLALDRDAAALARFPANSFLTVCCADLADPMAVDEALAKLPRDEKIALLVNVVGLIWNEPLLSFKGAKLVRHDIDNWRRAIDANLTAPFVVTAGVAARMARGGGGSIVNFSSVAARGNPGQPAYSAAKAGIEGLTRALAQELGPLGIRVNAIAPGFIDVPTTRNSLSNERLTHNVSRTPLNRLGRIEEIADAVAALEANAFMTGVVLPVDGGVRL
jgi:3-oxoacyl-[acyl-carrier protein] reductase